MTLQIVARQNVLERLIKTASNYAARDIGSAPHLQHILIDADKETGVVRFTAENDNSAIEFVEGQDIEIVKGGRIMIRAALLSTTIGVLESQEQVTIQVKKEGDKFATMSGERTEVKMPLFPIIEGKTLIPRVHEAAKNGVKITSDEFAEAYWTGRVAYDSQGNRPVLESVHIKLLENDTLRFLSFDGHAAAYSSAKVSDAGLDEFVTLVKPSFIDQAAVFINKGDEVILSNGAGDGEDTQLHLTVLGRDQQDKENVTTMYHIRVATIADGLASHPNEKLVSNLSGLFKRVDKFFTINKGDLLGAFGAAERIAVLNHTGAGKDVTLRFTEESVNLSVEGETRFERTLDFQQWNGGKEAFVFRWGRYGSALETVRGAGETIRVGVSYSPKGDVAGLVLVSTDEDIEFGSSTLPTEYLAILPTNTLAA